MLFLAKLIGWPWFVSRAEYARLCDDLRKLQHEVRIGELLALEIIVGESKVEERPDELDVTSFRGPDRVIAGLMRAYCKECNRECHYFGRIDDRRYFYACSCQPITAKG